MPKPLLFVSYSHQDRVVKNLIDDMLQGLQQDFVLDIQNDERLQWGTEWEPEILSWVEQCNIALLLLSDEFLKSQFIKKKELKRLQERHRKDEKNPYILPIRVRDCEEPIPAWIKDRQFKPNEKDALGSMPTEQRDAALKVMQANLREILEQLAPSPPVPVEEPAKVIDIDVTLSHRDRNLYLGEMRTTYPDEERPKPVIAFEALFDRGKKRTLDHKPYGIYLGEQLFPDHPGIEETPGLIPRDDSSDDNAPRTPSSILEQALADAKTTDTVLHLRVAISSDARELNHLPWEQMRSPESQAPLALDPRVCFSRTIIGYNENWREIHLRRAPEAAEAIKVLIFVPGQAHVLDADENPIDEVDPQKQLEYAEACRIRSGQTIDSKVGGFDDLFSCLKAAPVDVLFLVVAKSKSDDGWPLLEFTRENGQTDHYRYQEVARAFRALREPPRLVILATPCIGASGQPSDDCAISGIQDFAPAIAEAGVAAVITTQAATRPKSWRTFLTGVFHRLLVYKRIDHAVSLARRDMHTEEQGRDDWWKPVLIGRLRSSHIWYRPGFENLDARERTNILTSLRSSLKQGTLLPIVGPGIIHDIAGSRREIARRWAYDYGFPMEHHNRMNLPQVAQYLQIQIGRQALESLLEDTLKSLIRERHKAELKHLPDNAKLDQLFRAVSAAQRKTHPDDEPHGLLARLDVPVYLTANLSSILEQALEENKKKPKTFTFRELARRELDGTDDNDIDDPTLDEPWVIHLFGTLNDLKNAALTEDDYFDFLSDFASTQSQRIVMHIKGKLADSSLLFLGFRIHHWTFRTLFRSIHRLEGRGRQRRYRHVAVQFDPDDDQMTNPEGAQEYLRLLFDEDDVNVYSGGAEDFLNELLPPSRNTGNGD